MGDTGLTGRKIIVDTYGGAARHGGGAFSGKDPTKVDRSAAYAARYVAKNVVAAGLADRCELQVAYAIGVAHPVSIAGRVLRHRARPARRASRSSSASTSTSARARSSRDLDLRRPIYAKTAAYGHFGRADHDFTWERTDKADALRAAAGLGDRSPRLLDPRRSAAGSGSPRAGRLLCSTSTSPRPCLLEQGSMLTKAAWRRREHLVPRATQASGTRPGRVALRDRG